MIDKSQYLMIHVRFIQKIIWILDHLHFQIIHLSITAPGNGTYFVYLLLYTCFNIVILYYSFCCIIVTILAKHFLSAVVRKLGTRRGSFKLMPTPLSLVTSLHSPISLASWLIQVWNVVSCQAKKYGDQWFSFHIVRWNNAENLILSYYRFFYVPCFLFRPSVAIN